MDAGAYYGHPGYYVYPVAPRPSGASAAGAGVMWIFTAIRDMIFAIFFWVASGFGGTLLLGNLPLVFVVMPLVGIAACGVAAYCDFSRRHADLGTAAAIAAVATSSFPGVLFVGPFGMMFSVIGLVLHLLARKHIRAREEQLRVAGAIA